MHIVQRCCLRMAISAALRCFGDSWLAFLSSGCLSIVFGPSLVADDFASPLVLQSLLMTVHHFLSLACAGSGCGHIRRLFVDNSQFVVFSLSAAV